MRFETLERALRLAGGVATVVTVGIIVADLRRGGSREIGRGGGRLLDALHHPLVIAAAFAASLPVLVGLWRPLPLRLSPRGRAATTLAGAGVFSAGIALFHWAKRSMGDMYDVSSSAGAQLFAGHRLVTGGPFAYVRHPVYIGGMLAYTGALLMYRTWAVLLITLNALSLVQRSRREEEVLAAQFGEQWYRYAERVPAWIPRLAAPLGR